MKPPPFDYTAPADVEGVLAALAEHGDEAKVLAGGQSLVPLLNFRLARPSVLVDVNRAAGLDGLRGAGALRIGATVRTAALERSPLVAGAWPVLAECAAHVGHPQIRSRGTVGGSAAHADPAAELPVVLTALGARFHVRGGGRDRVLAAGDFFRDHLTTALAPDELLVEVEVPPPAERSGAAFAEVARLDGDFALAGAAAAVTLAADGTCAEARLVLLGAGPTPLVTAAGGALAGAEPDGGALAEAAAAAAAEARPPSTHHAGARYRRALLAVTARRALEAALARARSA